MPREVVPARIRYVCDICHEAVEAEMKTSAALYPPHWAHLTFAQDAEDFSGAAVADATVKVLLCRACKVFAADALNKLRKVK